MRAPKIGGRPSFNAIPTRTESSATPSRQRACIAARPGPPVCRDAKTLNFTHRVKMLSYPADHSEYLERCHRGGQTKPTPLLLQYGEGDYNCLHQDVYGEDVFPLQVAFLLSRPGEDFTGGEFVLTEQRPRMQSRVSVVPLRQGDAVVFPVHHRPVRGIRGHYRVTMRHGVSEMLTGRRHTLG